MIEGLLYDHHYHAYWLWIEGYMVGQNRKNFSLNLIENSKDSRDEYDVLSIPKEFL